MTLVNIVVSLLEHLNGTHSTPLQGYQQFSQHPAEKPDPLHYVGPFTHEHGNLTLVTRQPNDRHIKFKDDILWLS